MISKRVVAALALVAGLAFPVLAEAQHHGGGGGGGGGGGHGGGGGGGGGHAGGMPGGGGHFAHPGGGWIGHPAWQGGGRFSHWRGGHWWRGNYGGRYGAWWIVGPDWYWYPSEAAPVPDPYTAADMAPGYWYYCDAYRQYYPYVGACPSGWRPVPPQY